MSTRLYLIKHYQDYGTGTRGGGKLWKHIIDNTLLVYMRQPDYTYQIKQRFHPQVDIIRWDYG